MTMHDARKRKCLVLFQSKTEVDGQYGPTTTWGEFAQAWVEMIPKRGDERFMSNEIESYISHDIRGDYFDLKDITPHMRMVYHSSMDYETVPDAALVFEIKAVITDHEELGNVMIKVEQEGRTYAEITG